MRRRPFPAVARLPLQEAMEAYCKSKRLTYVKTYWSYGKPAASVVFGRRHAFHAVAVQVKGRQPRTEPECDQLRGLGPLVRHDHA